MPNCQDVYCLAELIKYAHPTVAPSRRYFSYTVEEMREIGRRSRYALASYRMAGIAESIRRDPREGPRSLQPGRGSPDYRLGRDQREGPRYDGYHLGGPEAEGPRFHGFHLGRNDGVPRYETWEQRLFRTRFRRNQ